MELAEVLARAKFGPRLADRGHVGWTVMLDFTGVAQVVDPIPVPRLAPDPDDDVVIGTGIAARADMIVTGDAGLLSVSAPGVPPIGRVADALALISRSASNT
jgi:uncharacterized protein